MLRLIEWLWVQKSSSSRPVGFVNKLGEAPVSLEYYLQPPEWPLRRSLSMALMEKEGN